MKKSFVIGICIFLCAVIVVSTIYGKPNYNTKWMIGKTPEQIQDRYGQFHSVVRVSTHVKRATYKLRVADFWKAQDQRRLEIIFEYGVAVEVRKLSGAIGG